MLLSVVIVNWNSRDDLRRCLDSLRTQSHRELEIIVVDNGSSDDSVDMMRREYHEVTVIEAGDNLGFAEGCNRGIEASHGPWVAMLNNDTVADSRWAEALVTAAGAAPSCCGMLQSLLLFLSRPDEINSTGIILTRAARGYDRDGSTPRSGLRGADEIFCPTAGAAAYRRSMLDEVKLPDGWFDRRHFMYYEDLDLGWRCRLAGHEAWFVPESFVLHRYHGSSDRHGLSWLEVIQRINRLRSLLKNGSVRFWIENLFVTGFDLLAILRYGGIRAVRTLAEAVPASLRARRIIRGTIRVPREDVERRWAG